MACCLRAAKEDDKMLGLDSPEGHGRLAAMEERWKIMYSEQNRAPSHSVAHYITYLRRYVSETGQQRAVTSGKNTEKGPRTVTPEKWQTKAVNSESQRSLDSISPMSYFIRKLKLDMYMSYPSFVEEFVRPPNNGLRLLLSLLKNLQAASANPIGSVSRVAARGTPRMEEYKQSMVDEQDCLLCIKYGLRIGRAVDEIMGHNNGLFTITTCLLSNFFKSRITALEILTLLITGPSSVDRVLDAFTSMRIKYAESTRFKMLINMMYTRGMSHVLFQVSCLRLLNSLLNRCKSANMRVFLQYEMEEAGLDWDRIQEGAEGDGLEYDDLRREIREWKLRYIDVDSILRKIKADLKAEYPGTAVREFSYDQQFGPIYNTAITDIQGVQGQGHFLDDGKWTSYTGQKEVVYPYPPRVDPSFHNGQSVSTEKTPHAPYYNALHIDIQPPTPEHEVPTVRRLSDSTDDQPVYEVISRTPSPAISKHGTKHVNGVGTVIKDRSSGADRKLSTESEICEPYGLIIKMHSKKGHQKEQEIKDKNWILAPPDSANKHDHRKSEDSAAEKRLGHGGTGGHRNGVNGDRYDSGVSVTYPENEIGDDITKMYWENFYPPDKLVFGSEENSKSDQDSHGVITTEDKGWKNGVDNKWANTSGNTPRPFPSPRNNSVELGPLRWYNPGITPPQSFQTNRTHQSLWVVHQYQSEDVHHYNQQKHLNKPRTPTPDYNEESFDHESSQSQKPSMSVQSDMTSSVTPASSTTSSNLKRQPHVTLDNHSHFQRTQNIRKKSAPDIYKTPPRPPLPMEYKDKLHANSESNVVSPKTTTTKPTSNMGKSTNIKKAQSDFLKPPSNPVKTGYPKRTQDDSAHSSQITVPVSVHVVPVHDRSSSPSQHGHMESSHNSRGEVQEMTQSETTAPVPRERKQNSSALSGVSSSNVSSNCGNITANGEILHSQTMASALGHSKYKDNVVQRKSSISKTSSPKGDDSGSDNVKNKFVNKENNQQKFPDSEGENSQSSGVDSLRSYSAEIGRVLSDLDQTLEQHGWQESLKKHVKPQRPPLVAYV